MDLRSQYQGLSKEALIDKLLALDSHHKLESSSQASLDQSSQNAAPSTLEQLFLDHLSDGVIVTDNHSKIVWWNAGAEKMFGHSADEALGLGVGDLLHPDLESKYRLAIRHGLEQKGRWVGQIPTLCKDGTLTLCDSVVLRRLGDDGQALGTIGVNRNTGWQVKAEAAMVLQQGAESQLEASLQRYKELIECIPDLVWTVNIDGIIQQSGGTIDVMSETGVGATFSVYLPVATSGPVREVQAVPASPQMPLQGVTVLIAEDNPEVGSMLKRVLEQSGYGVLLAHSADAALDIARHTMGRIDLLITDYGMPGMNGLELSDKLALLHQETRVLHMSGVSDEMFADQVGKPQLHNFLAKPFGPKVLLERVSQILH